MDADLGHPKFDPHRRSHTLIGAGTFPQRSERTLGECEPENERVIVNGVKDTTPDFLRYLEKLGIGLGSAIELLEVEEFDGLEQ
ncbi:MAG: ferrous iron transport protein A [Owenweeksia sp.]|nr:ferrous iron transport protein A [Owenweeksia sp.]